VHASCTARVGSERQSFVPAWVAIRDSCLLDTDA